MRETNPFNHNNVHFVTKNCHVKTNWMNTSQQYMIKKNLTSAIHVRYPYQISNIWKGTLRQFMIGRSHSSAQLVINVSPEHICWIGILKQCMRGSSFSALCVLNGSLVKTNSKNTLMKDTKIQLKLRNR